MALLEWNPLYSVGISKIDDQHKKLIQLLNELYDAMMSGKGKDMLRQLLVELLQYTVYHFTTEEEMFLQFGYSRAAEHKKEHDDLRDKVTKLQVEVNTGKSAISIEVFNFLKEWVDIHILQSDLLYAEEFKNKF